MNAEFFQLRFEPFALVFCGLELTGIRLFNSARSVEICDDKMLTHIALSGKGICMPQTAAGLLCYTPDEYGFVKINAFFILF